MKKLIFNTIVECHLDINDPDTFVVGEIIASDDSYFLMRDINIYGKWNGFALYLLSDLVNLIVDGRYLERIRKLNLFYKDNTCVVDESLFTNKNLLIALLTYVMKMKKVVGVELNMSGNRDIDGIVVDILDDSAIIHQIDEFGCYDGYSLVKLDSITRCFFGDDESTCLEQLIIHK